MVILRSEATKNPKPLLTYYASHPDKRASQVAHGVGEPHLVDRPERWVVRRLWILHSVQNDRRARGVCHSEE